MKRLLSSVFMIGLSFFFLYSGKDQNWERQLDKFSNIQKIITENYFGPINIKKNVFTSIKGLLKTLDPHSYFLDPVTLRSVFEDQQGNYYGIGIRIIKYENRLTVLSILNDTPATKMGIYPGDVIAEIEGIPTADIPIEEAVKKLRGSKGTRVALKITRQGLPGPLTFQIKRAEIPLNSIAYTFVFPGQPKIGYIAIRTFGNTTPAEFQSNLKKLIRKHRIKSLILDLRGNSGGSLYAAIDISDFFLKKGKIIVTTRGRTTRETFLAKSNRQFEDLPLVILINRQSASASEIVASALQEHHKAIIVGSRSWGKGLVETVLRLPLNCAMALTTAKYYTPSNKCLQRDFSDWETYFSAPFARDYDTDETIRGGVIPDFVVRDESIPPLMARFISRGLFFRFSRYLIDSRVKIDRNFKADRTTIRQFAQFLLKNGIGFSQPEFDDCLEAIGYEIERDIISNKFSIEDGIKIFLKHDPVAKKAALILSTKLEEGA
jgi:carboxyl-terminal processing protease